MTSPFDTLDAARRLRDAGVEDRAADAIVDLVQSAARMPDISDLATKDDLNQASLATKSDINALALATKSDINELARTTKSDLNELALATKSDISELARTTKSDINQLALTTKADMQALRLELKGDIAALETRFSEKLRIQGWALMGGMATLITIYTALIKLLP